MSQCHEWTQCKNCIEKLYEIIRKNISRFYNVNDIESINYIISKYNVHNNWDYKSKTDISEYKYDIKMTLK